MRRLGKAIAFLGLAILLVAASVVAACGGGDEEETNTVVLGWLADQTGSSSTAFKEVSKGIDDYLANMEKTDPIEGVRIKVIAYDTRLEYGRYMQGYEWLVGQGMDVLLGYAPETSTVTLASQKEDRIPQYNFTGWPTTLDEDWVYSYAYSQEFEGRAVLDYLLKQWWPAQGKSGPMKVAHVSNPDWGSMGEYEKGLNWVVAQNPGKIELRSLGGGMSQTAWASEVAAVQDTDAVFLSAVGVSAASFLNEAVARGYQGRIVSASISVLGIWPLVTSIVDKTKLGGLLVPHLYPLFTDSGEYGEYLNEMIEEYRASEAATLKKGTTWMSGWLTGQILAETVRLAAAKVGAENVDGASLNDAFQELDLGIQGMPHITLANSGTHHVLLPYCRIIEYDAAKDDWFAITDWITSPGFAS